MPTPLMLVALMAALLEVQGTGCPSNASGYQQNVDYKNDDLEGPLTVSTVQECCAACVANPNCNAISFGPLPKFECRLKKGTGTPEPFKGRLSCVVRHPPPPRPVREVHVVASNHFDGGCKINGCQTEQPAGWVDPIWAPNQCAKTSRGWAQPHAYHVLNRYFTNYFPAAARLGDAARAGNQSAYVWMTQSWVIDLFLNCERSNYVADKRYGGQPLLQCPNSSQVAQFKRAVALGDIVWHAAATDQEAGYFPNAGMFEASLELNERIAAELGVKASTAVSTRDVPGWTRAAIPLLAKHGINGMSFGSGTPPGRPYGMPNLFVWRDLGSGKDVVVTSESGYGGIKELFLLANGVGMVADWTGDNSGPAGTEGALEELRKQYPGANVHSSTFSAFFDEANKPENKDQLPVVTAEMGDAWIYGVPSDPLKNMQFRELARARDECVGSGACNTSAPAMRDFDRLLVKIPEHTWGLAQAYFTRDYQNYTNQQFQAALADSLAAGPLADQTNTNPGAAKWRADYYTTIQAWVEQRSYITNAIGAIANAEAAAAAATADPTGPGVVDAATGVDDRLLGVPPGWAAELAARVAALSDVPLPTPASLLAAGYLKLPATAGPTELQCGSANGGIKLRLDGSGAIVHLSRGGGASWANDTRPIGKFLYQTFDDADYQAFLAPAPAGFGLSCPPSDTSALCGNFNRVNMTAANPKHAEASPTVSAVWARNASTGCSLATQAAMDPGLHVLAGAPATVWTMLDIAASSAAIPSTVTTNAAATGSNGTAGAADTTDTTGTVAAGSGGNGISIDMEVRMFNKTATRLPESIFVVFRPAFAVEPKPRDAGAAAAADKMTARHRHFLDLAELDHGWRLQMFNESDITLDPTDVLVNGSGSGGAPHTRCVSAVTHKGNRYRSSGSGGLDHPATAAAVAGTMLLSSADVPCVSTGVASPFPTPRDGVPDMRLGVGYNVVNNIWNTNYVLWYPFDDKDKDLKVRFSLQLEDTLTGSTS